jgi:hypothetical protein
VSPDDPSHPGHADRAPEEAPERESTAVRPHLVPPDVHIAMGTGLSLMTALRQSASWEDVPSEEDHNHSEVDDEEEADRQRAAHRAQPCEAVGIDKNRLMNCLQESASVLDIVVDSDTDEDERRPMMPPPSAPRRPTSAHSI